MAKTKITANSTDFLRIESDFEVVDNYSNVYDLVRREVLPFCLWGISKNGLILKLTAFHNLSIWAFRRRRALRYNLFCGKKSHKKGFPLQSLTQNAVVTRIKP
jgi:hypothetical protein